MNLPRFICHKITPLPGLFCCCLLISACLFSPPISIKPDKIEPAILGEEFYFSFKVQNNVTPVGGVDIIKGALPKGLSLNFNESNGSISIIGQAKELGSYHFSLSVWCFGTNYPGQTIEKSFSLRVVEKNNHQSL